jgi:hypothetical protein
VVVKLTPFCAETLDHFFFLERPADTPLSDGAGFERSRSYQRVAAYQGSMPSVQDYQTVGRLCEGLADNMKKFARRLGGEALFIGSVGA